MSQSLFLISLNFVKKDFCAGVFLRILRIIKNNIFTEQLSATVPVYEYLITN